MYIKQSSLLYRGQPLIRYLLLATVLSASLSTSTLADNNLNEKKLTFSFTGTMVEAAKPCTVNNGQPITVTFGNVGISQVDSGKYVQELHYNLDCGLPAILSKVSLKIKATPEWWDENTIATSVDGLGAQILMDSSPLKLNTDISINQFSPPALQVRLVKSPLITLKEQPFTASGTFIVEYV